MSGNISVEEVANRQFEECVNNSVEADYISKKVCLPKGSCFTKCVKDQISETYGIKINGEAGKLNINNIEYMVLIGGSEYELIGKPEDIQKFEEVMIHTY